MYFALYCILLEIVAFFPETDGSNLTWLQPLPFQVVSSANRVEHQNQTRLIEGTINASLIWNFNLTSELTFNSLTLQLNGVPISSNNVVLTGFRDKYAVNLIQSSEIIITLVIFEVTAAHNAIFSCEVFVTEQSPITWKSNVHVDVVAPPSNIVTSSPQTVAVPTELILNCSADGEPKPNVTWTRVSDSTVVAMPLNITGVKDGGTYKCTADNGVGKPLTKDVFVDVHFPPMVAVPSEVFVGREQTAFLICEVEGNPTPIISWSPCSEKNVICDERYLNISKVQTARANYTCTITNALGVDSATTVVLIGGKNIYLRLSVSGECDNKDSVWKILQKELVTVFTSYAQNYSGADLIGVSCGSLIFHVVLKFRTEVAEDDTISIIQNAIVDGKLGELSVNVSYIIGIPPVEQTTITAQSSITPKSNDHSSFGLIVIGTSIGVGLLLAVVFGVLIWWVLMRRNSRRETTKEMNPNGRHEHLNRGSLNHSDVGLLPELNEEYEISPGRLIKSEDAPESRISRPAYVNLQEVTLHSKMDSNPPHNEYAPLDLRTRSWEVAREDVTVEKIIGKGAFGQVAKGTAKNLSFRSGTGNVAIKMLKANAAESDKRDLKSELELMKTLKPHPHVIKLLGCVTESEPLLVLIEYVPYGDLLGYLRKSRGLNDTYYKDPDIKPKTSLTAQQLIKFAWQIADGMSYLSLRKVIHRDLAARNVLVGEKETCKITDFGMARDVQEENIYERKAKGRLPVKWTAFEALLYGQYTTKSDVWSYGVVLYELFTIVFNAFFAIEQWLELFILQSRLMIGTDFQNLHLRNTLMAKNSTSIVGGSPYPRVDGRKVVSLLQEGYRMQKPEHVDNKLYQIMMSCWQSEPEIRPSFADLTQQLKRMENRHKRLLNMHIYDNAMYANLEDLNA